MKIKNLNCKYDRNIYQYLTVTTTTNFTKNFITWLLISTLNSDHY